MPLRIIVDDLSGEATRRLIARHLEGMHELTPVESVHALDVDGLVATDVTVWSAWRGEEVVGVGALKTLDARRGELKSMRVSDAHRGTGAGRALLRHIVGAAAERGMTSLWLETGTGEAFTPAHRLYESEGFTRCGPFGDYRDDPLSVFMTRAL